MNKKYVYFCTYSQKKLRSLNNFFEIYVRREVLGALANCTIIVHLHTWLHIRCCRSALVFVTLGIVLWSTHTLDIIALCTVSGFKI